MLFLIIFFEFENFFVFASEISVLKWDQNVCDFVLIINETHSVEIKERNDRVLQSRLLEIHNFQKSPIRIGYFEENSIIETYDNGTKITGIIGQIWSDLSEYLNFTPVLIKSTNNFFAKTGPDGKIIGLSALLLNNDTDVIPNALMVPSVTNYFVTPYWADSMNLFTRPEYSSNKSWLLQIFSFNVLIFVILMMIVFSALGLTLEKLSSRMKTQKSIYTIQDHLFETFATFCSQGSFQEIQNKFKIFDFSRRIFTWFLLLTISSHLISLMTSIEVQPPFQNILYLLRKTDYRLLMREGSLTHSKFTTMAKTRSLKFAKLINSRITLTNADAEMYQMACHSKDKKYAIVELLGKRYSKQMKMCNLEPTGDLIQKSWSAGMVKKEYKYKRAFDIGIIKLREVGILSKMKSYLTRIDQEIADSNPTAIKFKHVDVLFVILLIGSIISAIICAGENFHFYCRRRKKQIKSKLLKGKKRFKELRKNKRAKK